MIRNALALAAVALALTVSPPAGATEREDDAVRLNIESNLAYQRALAGERLIVGFSEGRAVLSGTVRTLYQKWQAVETAARVRGVVLVDDRIAVFGQPQRDATLAESVRRRFDDVPKVASAKLKIEARDGAVTLAGTLRDARTRFDARDAAAQVPGVTDVVDRMTTEEIPDERLEKEVRNVLGRSSIRHVPGDVKVTVLGGVVHLEGWVPRLWERITAERNTLGINGVKEVINDLEVRPKPRLDADRP